MPPIPFTRFEMAPMQLQSALQRHAPAKAAAAAGEAAVEEHVEQLLRVEVVVEAERRAAAGAVRRPRQPGRLLAIPGGTKVCHSLLIRNPASTYFMPQQVRHAMWSARNSVRWLSVMSAVP